jgi:hypothetical protein
MHEFLSRIWVRYRGARIMHREWVGKKWSLQRLKRAMMWQSVCIGIYAAA